MQTFNKYSVENRNAASELRLLSGEVDNEILKLSFNEELGNSIPSPAKFTVKVNNRKSTLTNESKVFAEDGYLNLSLKNPVEAGDKVVISYKDLNGDQSNGVIEDKRGEDLESFNAFSLDNVTYDLTPPSLLDAYIEDGRLYLEFDELISTGKIKGSRLKLFVGRKNTNLTALRLQKLILIYHLN